MPKLENQNPGLFWGDPLRVPNDASRDILGASRAWAAPWPFGSKSDRKIQPCECWVGKLKPASVPNIFLSRHLFSCFQINHRNIRFHWIFCLLWTNNSVFSIELSLSAYFLSFELLLLQRIRFYWYVSTRLFVHLKVPHLPWTEFSLKVFS